MIEFDPTEKENRQNDHWNRVEQTLKSKFAFISSFSLIDFIDLAIDPSTWQESSDDHLKLFYDWLNLAFELHRIE